MSTLNLIRVVLWMTGALLSFSVMAVSIRLLARQLSVFEILTLRSFGALVILGGLLLLRPSLRPGVASRRLPMHFLRAALHFTGQYCWALSLTLLPFAIVFALESTLPIWALILAILILGEKLTSGRVVVIVMGLIGALVILRPGLTAFQPAALLVLAASFFYAAFNVLTKQMTATETTFGIVFWMNLLQLPMGLAGSDLLFPLKLEAWQTLPVIGVGFAGLSAHYCITMAFRYGDASMVLPLDFLRVPLIAIVGWMFFGEQVDALVFVGAAIILAGILWNLRAEARTPAIALPEDQGFSKPQ